MTLRKVIFWLHLAAGIVAGVVILIMSATGVLLTYEKQMIAWADSEFRAEPPPANSERLPMAVLMSKVSEAAGSPPASVTVYEGSAAVGAATSSATVYINAYTGQILGSGSTRLRAFFRYVTEWHRYLAAAGDNRPLGKAVTGAGNLIFLFIVGSGFFLWWPRTRWNRQTLRPVTWFRTGLSSKARNWNWHNVFGFWSTVPLFLVVLSATVISYPWASNLVYRITGTEAPAPAGGQNQNRGGAAPAEPDMSGLDVLMAEAEKQEANWRTISLRFPATVDAPVSFTIDRGSGGQPQLRSTLTMDRQTGEVVKLERFEDQNTGRRARSWLRFVHTGEFYGLAGQTIAGLASFGGVMLVWTGFALSWRRFRDWKRARRRIPSPLGDVARESLQSEKSY